MINEGFDQGVQTKKALSVEIRCLVPPTAEQRERIRAFMAGRYANENVELSVLLQNYDKKLNTRCGSG